MPAPSTATTYQARLRQHLATYKRAVLGVAEDGVWVKNGQPYAHILPAQRRYENLLATYRADLQHYLTAHAVKLHSDFHHLNSSQAMCFNLFFPLLAEEGGSRILTEVLGLQCAEPMRDKAGFERVPDPEERTNFDLVLPKANGGMAYFELKLSENGFGTAEPDKEHRDRLASVYRPRLDSMVQAALLEPPAFFARYQLCRNLAHVTQPTDQLFLVYPGANAILTREITDFLGFVNADRRAQVVPVLLEDLIAAITRAVTRGPERLREHYAAFTAKYLPA